MWSSGGLDDLVNHSCNPNTGLWQIEGTTYLIAIRPIAETEELSFDYSTSMVDEPWGMECCCGDSICRKGIGNFLDMPYDVQQYYASKGVLPEHVWVTAAERGVVLKKGSIVDTIAAAEGEASNTNIAENLSTSSTASTPKNIVSTVVSSV